MPPILQTISRLRHFDEARAPTNCTYETKPLSRKDTVEAQMSNVFHLPITEHTNRIAGPIACGQLCQRLGFYLALVAKQRNCASLPPVRPPDRAALESMKWRDALVVCWAYKLYRRGLFGNPIGVYLYLSEGALLKQGAGGAAFRQVRRVPSRAIGCSKSSFFFIPVS